MGLTIGLGGGNAGGGGGGGVAGGLIQDMAGVTWTGTAKITDKTITEFPGADFRDCTEIISLFYNCKNLVSVGEMKNTYRITNIDGLFDNCILLKSINVFDTSAVTIMAFVFNKCQHFERFPLLNTDNVHAYQFMFNGCTSLHTIEFLNMINVNDEDRCFNTFKECTSLKTAKISNLGVSLDLSWCKVLSVDSVLFLFNNAKSGVSGKTIQLNSLVFDQLTEEQIAIATEKGFSVTSVVKS